jgi:hypothetical protein
VNHNCLENVRPKFSDAQITVKVYNVLRRTGLTANQTLDAINEMQKSDIIFGELHLNGN